MVGGKRNKVIAVGGCNSIRNTFPTGIFLGDTNMLVTENMFPDPPTARCHLFKAQLQCPPLQTLRHIPDVPAKARGLSHSKSGGV